MKQSFNYTSCAIICTTSLVAIALFTDLEKLKMSRDMAVIAQGQENQREDFENIDESILETVIHDHHWFITTRSSHNYILHHPDCPCTSKQ